MAVNRSYIITLFNAINSSSLFKGYLVHSNTSYNDNVTNGIIGFFASSNSASGHVANGSSVSIIRGTTFTDNQYYLLSQLVEGSVQQQLYRNGVLNVQNTSLAISPENTARSLDILFSSATGNDLRTNEAIIWESYQSSNRTDIENNINLYYAIY
jgi:hypothetical protein